MDEAARDEVAVITRANTADASQAYRRGLWVHTTLADALRAAAERAGSVDYLQMWAGQAGRLAKSKPAEEFTRALAADALRLWEDGRRERE